MTKNSLRQVTRSGLGEVFGVSLPTVDSWVRSGCPVVKKGGRGVEWQFDTAEVAEWLKNRAVAAATDTGHADEKELKRRKLEAETLIVELELARQKGEVALIDEFARAQAAAFAGIRANVMNVPARVVTQLLGEKDETVFKQKLRAELVLALQAAASAEIEIEIEEDEEVFDDAGI